MMRFIARWRRMALTMGSTAFLHGRVSKILSFKLRLSDPMSCEIRGDMLPIWRPSMFFGALIARGHTGDYLQRLGRNLDAEASTQHEDLDERSAPFLFSRCLLQTASCVNSRSRLFDNL